MADRKSVVIPIDKVVFRTDLYPRLETSPTTVQAYAADLSVLPPIEVNQNNELIDGWHRWTAHKKNAVKEIACLVTKTDSDMHLLELAIERNAAHGLAMSLEDKKACAVKIYLSTPISERRGKREQLARILGVSEAKLSAMLSRTDKEERERRDKRILDLWLRCHTSDEIGEAEGITGAAVREITQEFSDLKKLAKSDQATADHAADFDPPIYNVWKQQEKSKGSSHFGNSEVRWVDNLLYLYTRPFDVVVDPFAGGGSTLDLCRKRWRRCWVSDRKPVVEREAEIRAHDVTAGLPELHKQLWQDVRLVYLDPPYWKQAEGKYSADGDDLANMDLERFTATLAELVNAFLKKLKAGAYVALLIQPTQWNAPERRFTDHVADVLRLVKAPLDMRFSCPYESQQCTAQMVEWAKENKKTLVLTRELIVWGVP
jgi:hypothetical protein